MEKVRFQLPAAEDDLWHQVTIRLLEQRDVDEEQAKNHLRLLEWLAFCRRFCEKPLTGAFVENTAMWLAEDTGIDRATPRKTVQQWLADLEQWELLLRHGSGNDATFEFAVPTLDEYFAARHLAARWAEDDEKYRIWLPCSEGWWERSELLRCPNPHCRATLPLFRDLVRQIGHEELLLLMVGLLRKAEREEIFLNRGYDYNDFVSLSDMDIPEAKQLRMFHNYHRFRDGKDFTHNVNFTLKALSRCRYAHAEFAEYLTYWVWDICSMDSIPCGIETGLFALGRTRVWDNLDPTLNSCVRAIRDWHGDPDDEGGLDRAAYVLRWIGSAAVKALIQEIRSIDRAYNLKVSGYTAALCRITNALSRQGGGAEESLIVALEDEDEGVRDVAAGALGCVGGTRAIKPLIKVLQDEDRFVRWNAGVSLGELLRKLYRYGASEAKLLIARMVVEALMETLEDISPDVRMSAILLLRAIGDKRAALALQRLSGDPDERVCVAAKKTLEEIENRTKAEHE